MLCHPYDKPTYKTKALRLVSTDKAHFAIIYSITLVCFDSKWRRISLLEPHLLNRIDHMYQWQESLYGTEKQ